MGGVEASFPDRGVAVRTPAPATSVSGNHKSCVRSLEQQALGESTGDPARTARLSSLKHRKKGAVSTSQRWGTRFKAVQLTPSPRLRHGGVTLGVPAWAPPLTGCVILDKSLQPSEPVSYQMGKIIVPPSQDY